MLDFVGRTGSLLINVITNLVMSLSLGLYAGVMTTGFVRAFFLQSAPAAIGDWIGYGVGGGVALLVMQWKRQDDQAHNKTLEAFNVRYETHLTNMMEVTRANTAALVALQATIGSQAQNESLYLRLLGALETKEYRDTQGGK